MNTSLAAQMAGVPMYAELSPSTLAQLSSMLNDKILPTTPYFFHSATFIFLIFLWAFTLLISAGMAFVFGKRYTSMNFDQRRTSDIYILNCVLTTAAACCQFACLGAFSLGFQRWQFDVTRIAAMLIASNYVFEMIYRPRMRYPMVAHHILTLFLIMLSMSVLYEVKDPTVLLSGNMLMFLATLEQPTFLALLFYRLKFNQRLVHWSLRISAVQTILFKSIAAAGAIAVWIKWQRFNKPSTSMAYNVLLWISIGGLYITQWWGAWVTWQISYGLKKRYETTYTNGSTPGLEELQQVDVLEKFEQEIKRSNRRSKYTSGASLRKGAIPTRTSSIYSPSPAPPLMDSPSSVSGATSESDVSVINDPNARVAPPASSAGNSVYEVPASELTHERRMGEEEEVAVPVAAARRFSEQRRRASISSTGHMCGDMA
ncbi:unnamed protein product [Tilletia controversa]|uniref:TLC domain-containing protein n=2 Tax=Tilletia TaxID=13289 RepID=A0A177VAL6_9BASI|nr:hypothetical protein CF336_g774 [Tilletia laevis]KAE8262982.1 hypothetical protein A4X03_0g2022 [Tilletia caries]CAD6901126.1 unnamed protein product [Tilletia controversa]KAE8203060.1 hypothetical protein CF335_g3179 [Tilletia laevis]CAD6890875.1 unnamed protein product [Tilletia caries]